jgi:hypothetical protein
MKKVTYSMAVMLVLVVQTDGCGQDKAVPHDVGRNVIKTPPYRIAPFMLDTATGTIWIVQWEESGSRLSKIEGELPWKVKSATPKRFEFFFLAGGEECVFDTATGRIWQLTVEFPDKNRSVGKWKELAKN